MQQFFETLAGDLAADRPAVLTTIVESRGSAPRSAGAKMAILQDGTCLGTIGGGIMEHLVQQRAKQALQAGETLEQTFSLAPNQAGSIGMICGGIVRVLFQYCTPSEAPFFQAIANALRNDADIWQALRFSPEAGWRAALYGSDKQRIAGQEIDLAGQCLDAEFNLISDAAGGFLFTEPLIQSGLVYIFGGGHISQELVPVLSHVGFRPVIFEDRPEFAQKDLFPGVAQVLLGDFMHFDQLISVRKQDYIAIMTRGHMADQQVLEQALRTPARYIGLIGSRSKMASTQEKLRAAGFKDADIARIHNPIGLPIYAETPAEIAISIAAELIAHRAKG